MATKFDHLSEETRDDLAGIALDLASNKDTRPAFLNIFKKVRPNTPVPELDAQAAVEEKLKVEREAREKFETEQRERWLNEEMNRTKSNVRSKYKLSEEDMGKMEKMMTEKQLPADYDWAAQLYVNQAKPAEPTNYGASGYGPADVKGYIGAMEGLIDDPDNWANRTAHEMVEEMRQKGQKPAF